MVAYSLHDLGLGLLVERHVLPNCLCCRLHGRSSHPRRRAGTRDPAGYPASDQGYQHGVGPPVPSGRQREQRRGSARRPRAICATSGSMPVVRALSRAGGRRSRGRAARRRGRRRSRARTPRPAAPGRRRSGWCRSRPPPAAGSLAAADQPGRVDPVGRHRGVRGGQQVGGREAELPAALVAADHHALQPVRPAERRAAAAARHPASTQAADVRRGEDRARRRRPAARPRR